MRILVPTDGSEHAAGAIEWLTTFPLPPSAQLRVLSVATLPPSSIAIPTVESYYQALREDGAAFAGAARTILTRRWPAVETELQEGEPREQILAAADAWQSDLIVLGARGLGTFKRAMLGSVSSAVVHHAVCPVLVVKGHPRALRRIVVAVDGSADAFAAARFCASLPLERDVEIQLLAVADMPTLPIGPPEMLGAPGWIPAPAELARARAALEAMLWSVEAAFRPRVNRVECSVIVGRAGAEIVSASEAGVDLVAVGARGLGGLGRLLLGSVSERVLHHAACPVLVVKRPRA